MIFCSFIDLSPIYPPMLVVRVNSLALSSHSFALQKQAGHMGSI